jgi:ankyrin repeat protein
MSNNYFQGRLYKMASEEEIEKNSLDLWNKIDNLKRNYSENSVKEIIDLIDSGNIDINFSYIKSQKRTFLHVASSNGHANIVEKLLDKGAEIDKEDKIGITPIMDAVATGHLNIVQLLLNRGADINKQGICRPLFTAINVENLDMVDLLIKNGAKISFEPNPRITPIHHIAIYKKSDVGVKLLNVFIKYSVNINEQDIYNDTPLHIATMTNNYKIAEALIENGASFDIKNNNGKTALDIAKEEKYTEIEKLMDKDARAFRIEELKIRNKKKKETEDVRRAENNKLAEIENDIATAMGDDTIKKPDTNVKNPDTNVSGDVDIDKLLEELGKLEGGKRTQKRKPRRQKTRRRRNKKSRKKRR